MPVILCQQIFEMSHRGHSICGDGQFILSTGPVINLRIWCHMNVQAYIYLQILPGLLVTFHCRWSGLSLKCGKDVLHYHLSVCCTVKVIFVETRKVGFVSLYMRDGRHRVFAALCGTRMSTRDSSSLLLFQDDDQCARPVRVSGVFLQYQPVLLFNFGYGICPLEHSTNREQLSTKRVTPIIIEFPWAARDCW